MKPALQLFLAIILACRLMPAGAGSFELVGASTVANEIIVPLIEPFKTATGSDIRLQAVGTGKGMIALFQGKTPAAMVAESLDDALYTTRQVAKKEGLVLSVPGGLVLTRLGKNRLVLIVHQDNPVVELSRTQIKDIFTGKIKNWLELGGDDRPITPVTSVLGNAIRTVIQRNVMDGEDYRTDIRETGIPGEAIPLVAKDKGAIAVVSLSGWSAHHNGTRIVKTPDYQHPLGLVTIGKPNPEIQRLIDFIQANSRI